jgi:hypothetical protein
MDRKMFRPSLLISLVVLVALTAGFVPAGQAKAATWDEAKLLAGDGGVGDYFGWSVAISGDTAVVGAMRDNTDVGSVYVYHYEAGAWVQEAHLIPAGGPYMCHFGCSVAIDGNTIVVGAEGYDDGAGAIYIYGRMGGGEWGIYDSFQASGHASNDHFGHSVAISGNTIVVGANLDDNPVTLKVDIGSAYIYRYESDMWAFKQQISAGTFGEAGDHFGESVAIDGNTIVVGAPLDDDVEHGTDSGSAYVFTKGETSWTRQQKITAGAYSAADDGFGGSVAISGDTIVAGASGNDDDGSRSGCAYVFSRSGTAWSQEQKLTADNAAEYNYFGKSVAISMDTIVIGAYNSSEKSTQAGAVYVFRDDGAGWTQDGDITAFDGASVFFGWSVSISGNTIIGGAYGSNFLTGSAYVVTAAAGNQVWYLDSTVSPFSVGCLNMEKAGTQSDSVLVGGGSGVTWLSDQTASTPVVYDAGTWSLRLETSDLTGNYSIVLGESSGGGSFTPFFMAPETGTFSSVPVTLSIPLDSVCVPSGHYLGLQILVKSGSGNVITEGGSYLAAPSGFPLFPVPEIPTGILLGVGLFGLAAYTIFFRRKTTVGVRT